MSSRAEEAPQRTRQINTGDMTRRRPWEATLPNRRSGFRSDDVRATKLLEVAALAPEEVSVRERWHL